MEKKEFFDKLTNQVKEINIKLTDEMIENYYLYSQLLLEWNEKINLTAITDLDEIIVKHFLDSLTINKYLKDCKKMIDVGTGAGFPGIPIKILNEKMEITLLDSLNKRLVFLEDIIEKCMLKNINTIHLRAEEAGQNENFREIYDVAVSRAVANSITLVEYLLPLVKLNGICILMKGNNIDEELETCEKAIKLLGGKIEKLDKITLPDTNIERNIIVIRKIKSTPKIYPRKNGIPLKKPLK